MAPSAHSQMPLHCNICPKKPNFSDVSHLLTHVASKGHLSHYYKVKVRSAQDEDSKALIDDYDHWYITWDIEKLMADRMSLKDRKKSAKSRSKAKTATAPPAKASPSNHQVDPELSYHPKLQTPTLPGPMPLLGYPFSYPYSETFDAGYRQRPHKPQMHLWSTQHPHSYKAVPLPSSSPTPIPRRVYPLVPRMLRDDPFVDSPPMADDQSDDFNAEASKLKGVQWPGMDIFDSATPDMKRKRNQKKATSVVEHLEANSLVVEATEMIFTPLGSLRKMRQITGNADFDSSPLKGYEPTPPKRRHSQRPVLAEKDVNKMGGHAAQQDLMPPPVVVQPSQKRSFNVFDERAVQNTDSYQQNSFTDNLSPYHGLYAIPYYGLYHPAIFPPPHFQGSLRGQQSFSSPRNKNRD